MPIVELFVCLVTLIASRYTIKVSTAPINAPRCGSLISKVSNFILSLTKVLGGDVVQNFGPLELAYGSHTKRDCWIDVSS